MGRVDNFFIKGIMDSDTHYSMLDNKSVVNAENLRISGVGEDGAFKFMKGSEIVSDYSENGQMQVIGMHRGNENKSYIFLAHPNGKSKIVEYDVETKVSRLIIQDNTVLRFDLIRWDKGVVIFPYKYLLSFNQIGDLLIFSNEVWKNVRCVNTTRLADYANGFTEEDITLNKKPPATEPRIFEFIKDNSISDKTKKDVFVSFAYRYKYKDGDWSALSFFSDTAFEMGGYKNEWFKIDAERMNLGMTNKFNAVKLVVNSGGKNVTEIQVIAREHNTNIAYIIYSANKKKLNIPDDIDSVSNPNFLPILYKFTNNYKVLSEDATKLLYSNTPDFPKTQDIAGSRLFIANYKEGYDLIDDNGNEINIDLAVRKDTLPAVTQQNNTTAVSMFNYSIGISYFDDYNKSTTVLNNANQISNELSVGFVDRLHRNILKAKPNHNPPSFATKFKFLVKAIELEFEILYITFAKKIGTKLFIKLNGDNINRVKKGDVLTRIDSAVSEQVDYTVIEVRVFDSTDGVTQKGFYAQLEVDYNFLLQSNGNNIITSYDRTWNVIDAVNGSTNPNRFDATSGYQGVYSGSVYNSNYNTGYLLKTNYGNIKEGDVINLTVTLTYGRDKRGRGEDAISISGTITIQQEMYASSNYDNIYDFLVDNFTNTYITVSNPNNGNEIFLLTNNYYPELVRDNAGWIYTWQPNDGNGRDERVVVKTNTTLSLVKGIKPISFRTSNLENINEFYFETPKSFKIINGQHIGAQSDGYFDIGFYNGYCWGNGIESYKIKDAFNAKKLNYNFRPNAIETNGYKQVHRKADITYSGIYNYELGINELSWFEPSEANWKTMPIGHGEIKRIISTDGDITVFFDKKIINQYYAKSLIADIQGNESLALSNEVLGAYKELEYNFGIADNPECIAVNSNIIYAVDKTSSVIYIKQGNEIQVINGIGTGKHAETVKLLKDNSSFLGSFNEAQGEYIIGLDHNKSITFNLTNKGFTNYTTNKFEFNFGMGGSYFTSYKGVVYENEVTEDYNNFAGQGNFEGKITFVVNPEIATDKVFKAIYQQTDKAWNMAIKTNLTETLMPKEVFVQKESFFYSDIFRDLKGGYTNCGVGVIKKINGNELIFSRDVTNEIAVLDVLKVNNSVVQSGINNIIGKSIFVTNSNGFNIGDFAYVEKQTTLTYRPNGTPIRGKWMEVTMTQNGNEEHFINSISTEVIKSYL